MFDRERAIELLEANDDTWDYEDLNDEELVKRLVNDIKCSIENRMKFKCKTLTCVQCWTKLLTTPQG